MADNFDLPKDHWIKRAHNASIHNRKQIQNSDLCGCFYCEKIFNPVVIKDWADEESPRLRQTAKCPYCRIDTVIGNNSGFEITKTFLADMNKHWFSS